MVAVYAPLSQFVDLIGLPMTLRLIDNFGGVSIYLPHATRVKARSPLAQVIGFEAMQKLAAAWPMESVMVPRGAAYLRRQRDAAICGDLAIMSVRDVALKYETTERNVHRIRAALAKR